MVEYREYEFLAKYVEKTENIEKSVHNADEMRSEINVIMYFLKKQYHYQ